VTHDGDLLPGAQAHAVEDFRVHHNFFMSANRAIERGEDLEYSLDGADAGKNAILLGEDGPDRHLGWRNTGVAGGIVGGTIFRQGIL
jgi:hypothetical protein